MQVSFKNCMISDLSNQVVYSTYRRFLLQDTSSNKYEHVYGPGS